MNSKSVSLILLLSLSLHAKVELVDKSFPKEFEFVFSRVKHQLNDEQLISMCEKIESALTNVPKKYVFYLLKSDIYKNILDFEYDSYTPGLSLNKNLLEQVERKFANNQKKYTPMAQWIYRSFISDLDFRIKAKENLNAAHESKFLRPWYKNMKDKTPEEFNSLVDQIALSSFQRTFILSNIISQNVVEEGNKQTIKYFLIDKTVNPDLEIENQKEKKLEEILPDKIEESIEQIDSLIPSKETRPAWKPEEDMPKEEIEEKAEIPTVNWKPKP